jgi:hypothetical protein
VSSVVADDPANVHMPFDDLATPMLQAVRVAGMRQRFPGCTFQTAPAAHPDINMVMSVINRAGNAPSGLTADVRCAFDDLLREAREARPA